MQNVTITYKSKKKEFKLGTEFYEVARSFEVKDAIAIKIGNDIKELSSKVEEDAKINFINIKDFAGYKMYQSGLKFLFLVSAREAFPGCEVRFLHSVPKGILCEVVTDKTLTSLDVSEIKGKMASNVSANHKFKKYNIEVKDAHDYYTAEKETEKANNLLTVSNNIVTMYKLKDELNYFYTLMPYSTEVINKYDLVFLGRNRIVIVCPSNTTNGVIPEYVHYENIVSNFMNSKKWLRRMGATYLSNMNDLVSSGKIKDFIEANELTFQHDIAKACENVMSMRDVRLILIAGPSSSGKTTTMKRFRTELIQRGYNVIGLSTDDYFVDRDKSPKDAKGNYDFECLQAIDLELLNKTLKDLLDGKEVEIPEYDFINGKQQFKGRKEKLTNNTFILIEGLHCLNDELIPFIEDKYKYKIYLSPFIPLNIDRHNYISTLDLRLIRRIVRDFWTRGRSVEQTINDWQQVRAGEENYIFPYVYQADTIVNTALAYEVGVLKVFVTPLLHSVSIDSPYYTESRRLLNYLQNFYTIPGKDVPDDSILREFIGRR